MGKGKQGSADATGDASGGRREKRLRFDKTPYRKQFAVLAGLSLLAAAAQWLLNGPMATVPQAGIMVAAVAVIGVGVGAWRWGDALYHYLASARSAVLILTTTAIMTGVGTVVLQGISEAEFTSRYGSFSGPLLLLGFDDVFHSYPFMLLLVLLGLTSTITVIRRRRTLLRWRHFGLLLTHLSVVALLIGAAIGAALGSKGMLHLEVGRSANSYVPDVKADEPRRPPVELGFDVRLDNFQLDNYEAEFKVYTYERDAAGEHKVVSAEDPAAGAKVGTPEPGTDVKVIVKRVFKRAQQTSTWVSAQTPAEKAARPGPAARVAMVQGGSRIANGWLRDSERVMRDPKGRFELRLEKTTPGAEALATLAKVGGKAAYEISAGSETVGVRPGNSYELADGRVVQVQEFLADFVYDNARGAALSRSDNPRNPALVVQVTDLRQTPPSRQTKYLFAKAEMRDMMQRSEHGKTDLVFQFNADAQHVDRSVVVVVDKAERIIVEDGKVVGREPMAWGKPFAPAAKDAELTLTVFEPVPAAVHRATWQESASGPDNPAIEVEAVRGADRATFVLKAKGSAPVQLSPKRIMVYHEKPNKVRNFKSTITVLQDNRPVMTRLMQVNHPQSYQGFDFYQSNYDPDNPRYSGLQVVHDPGLLLVNIAFWVLMYGVMHTVMLRRWTPWWERNPRRRQGQQSGDEGEVMA